MMNSERRAFWDRWDMLPRGVRVLCAVSGGADSMCLLHLLKSLEAERGITVLAAHFEHGLRGEESLRDMRFVEAQCETLGVPCFVGRGEVRGCADKERLGLEEAARKLRYAFLERTAAEQGCTRVATAHSADDNAETVLMNLVRGSGTRGLAGIPPRRGNIVRPLLETGREEIEAYLRANGIPHVEDSSNRERAFTRNRLRRDVLPLLREENPRLNESLLRASELLRRDADCLDALAADWLREHFDGMSLPAAALLELHPALSTRVLRALCPRSLTAAQTDEALAFAGDPAYGLLDLPGLRLRRERGRLYVTQDEPPAFPPRAIVPGAVTDFPELGLRVRAEKSSGDAAEIHSQFKTYRLACEKIMGDIIGSARRPGDRMHPAGRGVGKSLKALFLENNMTQAERAAALVFRDSGGILAVYPLACDERAAAAPGEEALLLTVETMKQTGENK